MVKIVKKSEPTNSEEKIKSLLTLSLQQCKDVDDHLEFGLTEIEHHLPELRKLHAQKDPHLYDEIADVYIWASMLRIANNVTSEIVNRRITRFTQKITAALAQKKSS